MKNRLSWVLILTLTTLLAGCGAGYDDGTGPVPNVPDLTVTWSLGTPAYGAIDVFSTLIVGGVFEKNQATAVDLTTHKVAWTLPQKIEVLGGRHFVHDDPESRSRLRASAAHSLGQTAGAPSAGVPGPVPVEAPRKQSSGSPSVDR